MILDYTEHKENVHLIDDFFINLAEIMMILRSHYSVKRVNTVKISLCLREIPHEGISGLSYIEKTMNYNNYNN